MSGPKHGARPDGTDRPGADKSGGDGSGADRPASRVRGWALALSGTVVAGLLVLALGLLLVWVAAGSAGSPGPGPVMVAGHAVGTGLAVLLHRTALRRTGALGRAAAFGPAGVLVLLGLLFWWN